MKFIKVIMVALLFIGLATTTTKANTILDVLVHQKITIENGHRFGKISYFDAKDLIREQARIESAILKANKDGVITVRERTKIAKLQQRADHNIWMASSIANRSLNPYRYGWNQNNYNGGQVCLPRSSRKSTIPAKRPKRISKKVIRRN